MEYLAFYSTLKELRELRPTTGRKWRGGRKLNDEISTESKEKC
jgi:hypothetical protein